VTWLVRHSASLRGMFDTLQAAIDGTVIQPGDPDYDDARKPALERFHDVKPQAVVRPTSAGDVAETIAFARRSALHLAARSGGHCFAGRSSTTGIVLDVAPMHEVTVDGDLASVGAGTRLHQLYADLWRHGRTLNIGCGQTVGIAGLTLGGGLGVLGRAYGLTCDRLLAAEVVLADGSVVSTDDDPDLLWALRGAGGGQFGVVTRLRFATIADPDTTLFHLTWQQADAADVIERWQAFAAGADDGLNANIRVVAGSDPDRAATLHLFGIHLGSGADTERLLAPCGDPATSDLAELPYRQAKPALSGLGAEPPSVEARYERSRSEFFARPLPRAIIDQLLAAFTSTRENGTYRELNFTPWGGAYNRPDESASAFAHRDELFLVEHLQQLPAGRIDAWVDESWGIAHPHGSGRVYPNFPDPDLDDPLRAYHGGNLARLRELKQRYDPDRFFHFPHGL
jgi:FAD/FMN-containing dehydrogenase